jgi:hypothetical protein
MFALDLHKLLRNEMESNQAIEAMCLSNKL